jgi:hypothetical protein
VFYKRRTIAWPQPDAEFHVLACVHMPRDVPALLTLLEEVASPSDLSPVAVQVLHLIEFAGRSSALLLINASAPSSSFEHSAHTGAARWTGAAVQAHLPRLHGVRGERGGRHRAHGGSGVAVRDHARRRHAALILLPFHKHRSVDGGLEVFNPAIQPLNQSIQRFSPVHGGGRVFVDRGLGGAGGTSRVAALFFGGRDDDREVVALATRMVSRREGASRGASATRSRSARPTMRACGSSWTGPTA